MTQSAGLDGECGKSTENSHKRMLQRVADPRDSQSFYQKELPMWNSILQRWYTNEELNRESLIHEGVIRVTTFEETNIEMTLLLFVFEWIYWVIQYAVISLCKCRKHFFSVHQSEKLVFANPFDEFRFFHFNRNCTDLRKIMSNDRMRMRLDKEEHKSNHILTNWRMIDKTKEFFIRLNVSKKKKWFNQWNLLSNLSE